MCSWQKKPKSQKVFYVFRFKVKNPSPCWKKKFSSVDLQLRPKFAHSASPKKRRSEREKGRKNREDLANSETAHAHPNIQKHHPFVLSSPPLSITPTTFRFSSSRKYDRSPDFKTRRRISKGWDRECQINSALTHVLYYIQTTFRSPELCVALMHCNACSRPLVIAYSCKFCNNTYHKSCCKSHRPICPLNSVRFKNSIAAFQLSTSDLSFEFASLDSDMAQDRHPLAAPPPPLKTCDPSLLPRNWENMTSAQQVTQIIQKVTQRTKNIQIFLLTLPFYLIK